MRPFVKLVLSAAIAVCSRQLLRAQDLAPRAYVITALHSNAVTLTWSFYDGGFNFNGTIPIIGATGTYNVPVFSVCRACSTARRCKSSTQPDGGEGLAKRKGEITLVARRGLKEAWSKDTSR
jgi:hypothetical protein